MYSVGIAYLLWLFSGFGAMGLHRFYLGKIPTGILWMCTGGLGMVGAIYDFFTLPAQVAAANNQRYGVRKTTASYQPYNVSSLWSTENSRAGESVEYAILREAKKNGGLISTTDAAIAAHISMDEAKKELDSMVTKGYAELRCRKTGSLVYSFPDMLDSSEPLENF
ncbi:hypothetical protein FACS1894164_08560 [Spirochaetia bacterium]|nr:hypothetical protein FACS1894164_08560 [Spirochaetia bacterium]